MSSVLQASARPEELAEAAPPAPAVALSPATVRLAEVAKPSHTERLRRAVNVVMAVAALVVLSPLMLFLAVLIKMTSSGPVIYKQTRVGLDRRNPFYDPGDGRRKVDYGGRLFTIYKFRTMRADPEARLQVWARPDDDRVTRVGKVLRRYRLDELPQLINVVKGDMNLVGPRPEQPNIFVRLRDEVEMYPLRQQVLPGITGWAQVNHHYDRSVEDVRTKVRYDLEYLSTRSPLKDLLILLRTLPAVLFKRGGW